MTINYSDFIKEPMFMLGLVRGRPLPTCLLSATVAVVQSSRLQALAGGLFEAKFELFGVKAVQ